MGHALDLVDVARALVIAIDFIAFIGVTLGIAAHEIGVLHAAHRFARSILAGDQVDGLCLPPGILFRNNIFDVADFYCHVYYSLLMLTVNYVVQYTSLPKVGQPVQNHFPASSKMVKLPRLHKIVSVSVWWLAEPATT